MTPSPRARRWLERALAVTGGGLLALAFPAPGLWWWPFVGLAPMLLLFAGSESGREAIWRSWLAGTGHFAVLYHWLFPHTHVFFLVVAAAFALTWIPLGWATWILLRRPPAPARAALALLVLPAVWVTMEFARSWHPLGGSWGKLGSSQWQVGPVLSLASLGGVWLLSFLLVLTSVAAALLFRRDVPTGSRALAAVLAGALVAATVSYGLLRPEPLVHGHLTVAGVQAGNVAEGGPRLAEHVRLTRGLTGSDAAFVVWGQSSVPFDLQQDARLRQTLTDLAAELDRPIVVNTDAERAGGQIAKVSVVVRPDGLGERYAKRRLVPFGEYIPAREALGWIESLTAAAAVDRVPGSQTVLFDLAGHRIGPLISYESLFPDMRRDLARAGAEVTVVQGSLATFHGTWALPQQASFEAVRAVETGRPAVLVSMTGTSVAFDARGRELTRMPRDETGTWVAEIPLSTERTAYVRWGDWVPYASMAIVLAAAVACAVRRWRHRNAYPSSAAGS